MGDDVIREGIEPEEALDRLRLGLPLEDVEVLGDLPLRVLGEDSIVTTPITLRRCLLRGLDDGFSQHHEPVLMEDCRCSGDLKFEGAYFFHGLVMRDCTIQGDVQAMWGGHNRNGAEMRLERCTFTGFVDFEDCCFEGPVVIRDCRFVKGSNLLGLQGEPVEVHFDVPPELDGNVGALDLHRRLVGE